MLFSTSSSIEFGLEIFPNSHGDNEVQLINNFFIDMSLVLYLKSHHHTQGHLDFITFFLIGVLGFFILL